MTHDLAGWALVLLALLVVGCGASAVQTHAAAATIAAGTLETAGAVLDEARGAALDRVEAQYPADPEHDEELLREAARWRPVGAALDTARSTILTWLASVEAAHVAGEDGLALAVLAPIAGRLVALYAEVVRLAASLGVDELPELPAIVNRIGLGLGGGR